MTENLVKIRTTTLCKKSRKNSNFFESAATLQRWISREEAQKAQKKENGCHPICAMTFLCPAAHLLRSLWFFAAKFCLYRAYRLLGSRRYRVAVGPQIHSSYWEKWTRLPRCDYN